MEANKLKAELAITISKLQEAEKAIVSCEKEVESLEKRLKTSEETLNTTSSNYKTQLSMMTEHICALNANVENTEKELAKYRGLFGELSSN